MGKVVIYKDKKDFFIGNFQEEKNGRIYLVNEKNIVINISKDKIIKIFEDNKKINKTEIIYTSKELYEILKDLKESYTIDEILELSFQDGYNYEDFYNILKILNNKIYFNISFDENNNININLNSQEDVKIAEIEYEKELERKKIESEKNKERTIESFVEEINEIITKKKENIIVNPTDELIKYLSIFKELLIVGDEYSKKKEAFSKYLEIQKLLNKNIQNVTINDIGLFLEKINIINPYDEEIFIRRYKLRTSKNNYTEKDIKTDEIERYRKDLTKILTFTIDDIETMDIDDAISVEFYTKNNKQFYRLYIHIADPDSVIKRGENIDLEAYKRSSSVYLCNKVINMLPNDLSENLVSLVEGRIRNALTLQFDINENLEIINKEIFFSKINVNKNFSYDEIDKIFIEKNFKNSNYQNFIESFLFLEKFTNKMVEERLKNRAIIIQQPEIKFFIDQDGKIDFRYYNVETTTHNIIRELMILFNSFVANFFIENKIFALFVSQEEPQYTVDFDIYKQYYTKEEILKLFSILKKSVISTTPSLHFMMGLPSYTQMTSPIRRYQDLVNHRILKDYLIYNKIQYSNDKLEEIAITISNNVANIRQAERDSYKYWVLRYLEQNKNETYKGIVTKKIPGGLMCAIDTFNIKLKVNGNDKVELYDEVLLKIKSVMPYQLDARIVYNSQNH